MDAACEMLGAPKGWVAVPSDDGREMVILFARGYPPEALAPWLHVPIDMDVPMTAVFRTGRTIAHASADARALEYPAVVDHGGAVRFTEASAVVPMTFEGRTTGALAVTFDEVRSIEDVDQWVLESLATQGAGGLERARLFEAVRERDARLSLALEASGTWIWEWNVEANAVKWTPEPPAVAGPVTDPTRSEDWMLTVHPDDRDRVRETLETCIQSGGTYEVEFRIGQPGDPEVWLAGVGRLVSEAGKPSTIIGTTRDITERKIAELERERRLEAERDAGRLRDAFIGVVSHELRTPITTIFGGTRVLSRRWRDMDPSARDALLTDVSGEADRLYRLVEDLLVLTRVERGRLDVGDEPVAVRPIIERVVASERIRSPEVTFEVHIGPDLPSAQGEDTYVEQIIRNLLTNAAKYGGAGSHVVVVASTTADQLVVRVLDEGPGIADDEAEAIFELFYRSPSTAPTVTGAGIGLFVCRQLATAMGGSVHAERRPDGGAAFVLTLERYGDDEDA